MLFYLFHRRKGSVDWMKLVENVSELIGGTPMIRLKFENGVEIFAKCEFLNPSGSVKDRIAKKMIEEAEKRGDIKPGDTLVEPTSGNTGIALSCAAAAKGYKMVVVMCEIASEERKSIMRHYNAKVVLTPAADFVEGAVNKAKELAEQPGWWMPNQFENMDNVEAHRITTGREILSQLPSGKADAFIAGIGTGGTLMGVAEVLKEANPDVKIFGVDPCGSKESYEQYEEFKCRKHQIEGIGDGFIPAITDVSIIDEVIPVFDEDAIATAQTLARTRGLFVGISSGAYVWTALQVAEKIGKDKVIVTLLPDSADRYYSTNLCII
jgi:cysteine synthase A